MNILADIISSYRFRAQIVETPFLEGEFTLVEEPIKNQLPFHCVEKGGCLVSVNNTLYELNEGDFIAIMQKQNHHILNKSTDIPPQTKLICGHFQILTGTFNHLSKSFPEVIHVKREQIDQSPPLKLIMKILKEEVNNKEAGYKTITNNIAGIVFVFLLRNILKNQTFNGGILAALSDKKLSKSIEGFHSTFHEDWSIKKLAESAGMSRSAYIEKFQKIVGMSPGKYITHWRLNWASNQLIETNQAIIDIAIASGYNSDAAFSRVFSQQYGLSPSKYRKLNQHT